ncbi:MAG TPA: 4-alpha-glucanotransferase, partial [Kofleriaceae bacterium]|nr:4-alpha-glucanotransferase [Kofleriaceae bacterium]
IASIARGAYEPDGAFAGLVPPEELAAAVGDGGGRGDHRRGHDVSHGLAAAAWRAFAPGARPELRARLDAFRRANAGWLERDALHAALAAVYGTGDARRWPDDVERTLWAADDDVRRERRAALARTHAEAIERYAFAQLVAHVEHARVRAHVAALGLSLYADLQVGYSETDAWTQAAAFMPRYLMGAPPSRTNPDGQPWGYPVLDPAQLEAGGAARALVRARADKAFAEYDSLRVDHPHGLVCPWVYRAEATPPLAAVRGGARLFESPDLPDHPELARWARVEPAQLDRSQPRHGDHWVRALTPAQVDRYAVLVDELVAAARRHGRDPADLSCEVLSTMPRPLGAVLARHGLGRWRVLQKANLDDPADVYRSEQAARADWVMLGTHDTASIFAVLDGWDEARRARWATHLARRLRLPPSAEAVGALAGEPGLFAAAMLADGLASPAENALVFFADLFGYRERFNAPGTVNDDNWSLRLPSTFADVYRERLERGAALDLPRAIALALHVRGAAPALIARTAAAGTPLPPLLAAALRAPPSPA